MKVVSSRAAWLTVLALVAVAAVNVAGVWGISVARRAATEEGTRVFRGETAARARALEGTLAAIRSDMEFLAAASPLSAAHEAEASAWRQGAEGVLLLFLRAHPPVVRAVVRSADGRPLVQTGRRGGVPLLWVSTNPTGMEGAAVAPNVPRLKSELTLGQPQGAQPARLEIEIASTALLESQDAPPPADPRCLLSDAKGAVLARSPQSARWPSEQAGKDDARADAPVAADGWSAPGPWRLACWQSDARAAALLRPLEGRYRTTLAVNVAAMGLAVLLGLAAIQQARRRERMEARAREEARVRELERQLMHAERLATVGRLAAGIAHEINNPLEGMANYLTLARDALARGDTAEAQARLDSVRQGLERAAGVVRRVLAHADPSTAPKSEVDLVRVLSETADFVRARPEFREARVALQLPERPLPVQGNAVMLGQVALNLILNACEAQPDGGSVEVRAWTEGADVVAEVADRGPGVPEADRQRIFEPFFSTKDSTGLGLSVCHSIVRDHGGALSVRARDGGGSVFQVRLPAAASA